MRALCLAISILIAAPAAAQDHSAHQQTQDHSRHQVPVEKAEVDHCAMGHLPPEQCPPKDQTSVENADNSETDHSEHQQDATMDHSQMDHSQMGGSGHSMAQDKSVPGAAPESAVPARAFDGPDHAADAIWGSEAMAPSRATLFLENGSMKTGMVMIERLEARFPADGGETGFVWDAQAWYGGDINRFVLKTEGEGEFSEGLEDAEVQALYSRAIDPYFDLQVGVRFDPEPDTRSHLVLGVQGLAPYMFEVDGAVFLSDQGDLTARFEAEYDQKITQQLILQPRVEIEMAAQDIPERDIGAGLTRIEPGLRLRYEFVPEFAPYVGIEYEGKLGETADIARAEGEDAGDIKFLIGLRAWF